MRDIESQTIVDEPQVYPTFDLFMNIQCSGNYLLPSSWNIDYLPTAHIGPYVFDGMTPMNIKITGFAGSLNVPNFGIYHDGDLEVPCLILFGHCSKVTIEWTE